jgi:hypothetical protein
LSNAPGGTLYSTAGPFGALSAADQPQYAADTALLLHAHPTVVKALVYSPSGEPAHASALQDWNLLVKAAKDFEGAKNVLCVRCGRVWMRIN